MRVLGVAAATAIAVMGAALEAGGASAGGGSLRATFPSTVEVTRIVFIQPAGSGEVHAARDSCLSNRAVRIIALTDAGPVRISRDRSSDNGFWGGEGPAANVNGIRAVMAPKRLGPGKRCRGDTDEFSIRPAAREARRETFPTQIELLQLNVGEKTFVNGILTARATCRANRRVRIAAITDGQPRLVDTDRASDNGYFGGGGTAPGATGVRASAPVKRLGPNRRCAAASTQGDF
jgi:hypothetical protein